MRSRTAIVSVTQNYSKAIGGLKMICHHHRKEPLNRHLVHF